MGFQVMAKPIGAKCNLDCAYCYYSEKAGLHHGQAGLKMPPEVLEEFIRQNLGCQDSGEVQFVWQGGEPTLLGIDFFEQVVRLQDKYAGAKKVVNSIQTNGTLLNHEWGAFLGQYGFLVGLSIDGPRELHDRYRKARGGRPTFDSVMAGLEVLDRHGVDFNTLTVVNDQNARRPMAVYEFLKSIGHGHMQFIPAVERRADGPAARPRLALPPSAHAPLTDLPLTPWSVAPEQLADFYLAVFDQWVSHDVGSVFVQFFEVALANWLGAGSGLCNFAPTCGSGPVLEHNGDLYSCDHYVYPAHRLGNIMATPLAELMASEEQRRFGQHKLSALPDRCRSCQVRLLCHGDCPKNRFAATADGKPGLSYLCAAYHRIFSHMAPALGIMADLLRAGQPASAVMGILQQGGSAVRARTPGRNAPCPCGSGKKYKRCCGA